VVARTESRKKCRPGDEFLQREDVETAALGWGTIRRNLWWSAYFRELQPRGGKAGCKTRDIRGDCLPFLATATCLWLLLVRLVQRLVQPSSRPSLVGSRCSRASLCPDRLVAPGLAQWVADGVLLRGTVLLHPILCQGSGGGTHPLGGQPPRTSAARAAARVSRGRWRREPTTRDDDSAPPSLQRTAAGIPRAASLLEKAGTRQHTGSPFSSADSRGRPSIGATSRRTLGVFRPPATRNRLLHVVLTPRDFRPTPSVLAVSSSYGPSDIGDVYGCLDFLSVLGGWMHWVFTTLPSRLAGLINLVAGPIPPELTDPLRRGQRTPSMRSARHEIFRYSLTREKDTHRFPHSHQWVRGRSP
jgi:hypothetical protein